MASKLKNFSAAKRFGPRYGRKLRNKFITVENQKNQKYTCPSCRYQKVKRLAVGIWHCTKCDNKFAARAYSAEVRKRATEKTVQQFGLSEDMIKQAEQKVALHEKKREERRLAREEAKKKKAEEEAQLAFDAGVELNEEVQPESVESAQQEKAEKEAANEEFDKQEE